MLTLNMVTIESVGQQINPFGEDFELFNVFNAEPLGIANGSTVSRNMLREKGLDQSITKDES